MPSSTTAAVLTALLAAATPATPAEVRAPAIAEPAFDFGAVAQGTKVEHAFAIENRRAEPLRIERVVLSPPLVVRRMPAVVPPGARAELQVELPTASLTGPFTGAIVVITGQPGADQLELEVSGRVIPSIEVLPMRAVLLAGTRSEPGTASLELVSHEDRPIRIERVEVPADRLATRLETVEEGRRWRLVLKLLPDGPAGRHSERLTVHTTSPSSPRISILAHTFLRERVYTFPDTVDLGAIPLSAVKRDPSRFAQTLMVYQSGGTDFRATFRSDLRGLSLAPVRGPKGDRFQTTVALGPDALVPGPISGTITVETNDPEFPRVTVPVSGVLLE